MLNVILGVLAKNGSFGFAKDRLVCRAKPNVPLTNGFIIDFGVHDSLRLIVRLAKTVFKKVRWKKNKKHRVGLSVGLLAVQLQYGLYIFGHLSKWFVFILMFKIWSVCRLVNGRPTIGYNVLRLGEVYLCCACGKKILPNRC